MVFFFFSSRRRHTRSLRDWSSDVCSSDLVLGGVAKATEVGALTIGISCTAGSALSSAVEVAIDLLVGPELIAGSTRLKSGTAQKVVLNAISTITMVRL